MAAQAGFQLTQLRCIEAGLLGQTVDKINVTEADSKALYACGLHSSCCQHDDLGISSCTAGAQHLHTGLFKLTLTSGLNLLIAIKIRQIAEPFNFFAALQACCRQARNWRCHIIAQHQKIVAAVEKAKIALRAACTKGIYIFKIRRLYLIVAPLIKHADNCVFDRAACFHLSRQNILRSVRNLIHLICHFFPL